MKNLLFSIISIVLSTASYAQKEIKPSEIGLYHNEAIKLYAEKYINTNSNLSGFTIETVTKGMLSELKDKYPDEFKNADVKDVLEYYRDYKTISDYDFQKNWEKNKFNYKSKGYLSELTFNLIDESVKNNYDVEKLSLVIKEVKASSKLSDKDKLSLEVAESVLNSSNELWITSKYNMKSKRKNWCNQQIIISDAATSLMFFASGPLSIIAGAVSSLVTASTGDCNK